MTGGYTREYDQSLNMCSTCYIYRYLTSDILRENLRTTDIERTEDHSLRELRTTHILRELRTTHIERELKTTH